MDMSDLGGAHPIERQDRLHGAWLEIDLDAINHNVRVICAGLRPRGELMAVVKADGYGHGAVTIARAALHSGAKWLGVDNMAEAMELRQAGIIAPMLILVPPMGWQIALAVKHRLRVAVCTYDLARELSQEARKKGMTALVHVKVDTGMGRLGVLAGDAVDFVRQIRGLPNLVVEGIFSHFATAGALDSTYASRQFSAFLQVLRELEQADIHIPIQHMANSAAAFTVPDTQLSLIRSGIAICGLSPLEGSHPSGANGGFGGVAEPTLIPALELKALVDFVHRVPAGTGISYDARYVTSKETNIATIALGYAQGYSRSLCGKAEVLLRGKRYPLVGNICMGQCMADVGDDYVGIGDTAVFLGRQGEEYIGAGELAAWMGTIHYEVLCMLGDKLPRFYHGQEARRQGLGPS